MSKKSIAIIGGGPAAMALACHLDTAIYKVSIYEQNKTLGRKFLVAGKGGFNLTHAENVEAMMSRYEPVDFLEPMLHTFNNEALRSWLATIGIPTYTGSSSRVFPERGIKPIQVLNAIKQQIVANQVSIHYEHQWVGWNEHNELVFANIKENNKTVISDYVVFALGGGSWKVTGSDGQWLDKFKEKGIAVTPFTARNCAFGIEWKESFRKGMAGQPLKNIAVSCMDKTQKGELVITAFGLEGNAIYALSSEIQNLLHKNGSADITLDLKPSLSSEQLKSKFYSGGLSNTSTILRERIKLNKTQLALIKAVLSKEQFLDKSFLIPAVKRLPLKVSAAAPLDEAISTMGGIQLTNLDKHLQLNFLANTYCVGEMLDWNAPTGGYLLQACFSMGTYLANYFNQLSHSTNS